MIIIRLQNLPWSANASDIRQFFKGLHIPEGGVHIVGGENGDAFIAFSTDEDARQAMSMTGRKLKEVQVSLMLSSRAEMQKVIEKARMLSMQITQKASQMQTLPSVEAFTNQFGRKLPTDNTNIINTQQQQQQITMPSYQQQPAIVSTPLINFQMKPSDLLSNLQTNVAPPNLTANQLPLYNSYNQLNSVEYLNYVKMANAAGSFNADNNKSQQDSFNVTNQAGTSRERQRSRSPLSRYDSDDGKKERRRRTRFSSPENNKPASVMPAAVISTILQQKPPIQIPLQNQQQQAVISTNMLSNLNTPKLSNSIWDVPPINLNAFSTFNANANNSMLNNNLVATNFTQTRNYQTVNDNKAFLPSVQQYQSNLNNNSGSDVGRCIKVANVDKETNYSDICKFFTGLPVDDIKFLKDSKGHHSGVVLIKFKSSDSKKQSMTKNGWQLNSTQIMITSITEDDYENGLDTKSRDGYNNRRNDDSRRDRYHDRYRERSDSRDRDYDSRERDRDRGGDRYNRNRGPNGRSMNNNNNNNNRMNNREYGSGGMNNQRFNNNRKDFRRDGSDGQRYNNRRDNEPEEKIEYVPDENYKVLIIDDIPDKNEQDLCEAFPNIVSITIDKYTAYVKFTTHEAAKAVLENRFLHYIRNKRVFVETGSEMQFNDYAKKFGRFDNPEMKEHLENEEPETINENSSESQEPLSMDNSSNDDRSRSSSIISRDPRQRMFQNGNDRGNNGTMPKIRTDCILMKNLETNSSIEDVENFFSEIQRNNIRTHILLDKQGQPCGDCFVEFKYEHDMQKALAKHNTMMGQNKVQIMPIPREQVEAVLSSFGDDNGKPQNNRSMNRDWAPPSDFGSPGCVVMISNLCYRATIDDIINEFREFDLQPDQIIRRYNDHGQPTGNACINFNSTSDAEKACDKYNKVKILNRPVWLRLL